jgi:hypothetical protein
MSSRRRIAPMRRMAGNKKRGSRRMQRCRARDFMDLCVGRCRGLKHPRAVLQVDIVCGIAPSNPGFASTTRNEAREQAERTPGQLSRPVEK